MARQNARLACLALVLSPLCLGAHRVTKDHASGPSSVVNDDELVHNTCKDALDEGVCSHDKADTCVWVWDKAAKYNCRPKTCVNLHGSDCRELSSQCLWKWYAGDYNGECQDLIALATQSESNDNPCKDLRGPDCRDKSEVCTWDWFEPTLTRSCRPKTCAGIKYSDCLELSGQCSWMWDDATHTGKCRDLAEPWTTRSDEHPCKNISMAECSGKSDLCTWVSNTTADSGGECRPKSCAGIEASDCQELSDPPGKRTAVGARLHRQVLAKATTVTRAKLKDNPCKGLKASVCRGKFDEVCVWDWNFQTNAAYCRPRTCAGIKPSDCEELAGQCTWRRDRDTATGACLEVPKELVSNPCKHLTEVNCDSRRPHCQGHWDELSQRAYCGPRTCVGLKGSDCQNLTSLCAWKWHEDSQTGECLDLPKAPFSNPCKEDRHCSSRSLVCSQFWISSREWSCKPITCVGIKGSDCKELTGQCTWQEEGRLNGDCLDRNPGAFITPNHCKGLSVDRCDQKKYVCEWHWDPQTRTPGCRPRTCAEIREVDCKNLTDQCAWSSESGECLDLPKPLPSPKRDDPCRGARRTCPKSACSWDFSTSWTNRPCRPKTCAGLKGSHCRELTGVCVWRWDWDSEDGKCLDLPEDNPCKGVTNGSDCRVRGDVCVWDWDTDTTTGSSLAGKCRPKTCAGIKEADCRDLSTQCNWTSWLDHDTQYGECRDLPQPPATLTRRNPCRRMMNLECWLNRDVCIWDLGRCWPNTCDGIEHRDCNTLRPRCAWRAEDEDSQTSGECMDVREWGDPCKDLDLNECKEEVDDCVWDKLTTSCRPKTCAHIKGNDCQNLTMQCIWRWYPKSSVGKCLDFPTKNPCKDLKASDCRAKRELCLWGWDEQTQSGSCRPLTCEGIRQHDCLELKNQCIWRHYPDLHFGECRNPPPTAPRTTVTISTSTSTMAGPRFKDNPCKALTGTECIEKKEVCVLNWDELALTYHCKPTTCEGIKYSDCTDLSGHCTWRRFPGQQYGACENERPKAPTTTTFSWIAPDSVVPARPTRENPCKDLRLNDCTEKTEVCFWDVEDSSCKPTSCDGIIRSDCRELLRLCRWTFSPYLREGICWGRKLRKAPPIPPTTSVTTVASSGFREDPCKGLNGKDCKVNAKACNWHWDWETLTGRCVPKSCTAITNTDCMALTGYCGLVWDNVGKRSVCVDVERADHAKHRCLDLRAEECKVLKGCKWQPHKSGCLPRTCVGLNGTDCRRLPYQCLWKWDDDFRSGECLNLILSTTATTTSSAGDPAARLFALLLASLFFLAGGFSTP